MTDTKGNAEPSAGADTALRAGAATADAPPQAGPKSSPPASKRGGKMSLAEMLVGTVLADRYKLTRRIGEGAMGWVFLAEHIEIGKKCAVKVLRPALCRMPEAVRRFRREARAATQIGSKHIVDVTDFGATPNGAAFMVMEHLEGEDLGTTLKTNGRLPWERVVHIVDQCCEALQAAHDCEIIHRDVKPANLYRVDVDGDEDYIKVLDFGIARLTTPNDSIITATGVVMGTPDYMAPEQAQGRHVDHRADIYALGASAYSLVTGRPPFTGTNEYDIIYKQLNEDPRPPSVAAPNSEIPPWFDAIILKSMEKDPDARYQSMREFAEVLRARGAGVPQPTASAPSMSGAGTSVSGPMDASVSGPIDTSSRPQRRVATKPPRPKSDPMPSPVVLMLAALALAGVGALAVWLYQAYLS